MFLPSIAIFGFTKGTSNLVVRNIWHPQKENNHWAYSEYNLVHEEFTKDMGLDLN